MSISIFPVTPNFVAEVGDVDLSAPAESELAEIKEAFWKYAVLIFPGQHLQPGQHLAFAKTFGPVETDRVLDPKKTPHRLDHAFADISNIAPDGKIWAEDDLVMWDNRYAMHRGTDYEDLRWVRDMRRATVSDVANTCEQEGVSVPA